MIANPLIDTFGRKHDYLRISLTDRCNFRCTYCMPRENMKFMPGDKLMRWEEIIELAGIFKTLGVKRVRLTGGEPLLRRDFGEILQGLSKLKLDLSITTNGLLLQEHKADMKRFGLKDINVSIDSIDQENFFNITKRDKLEEVVKNIKDFRDSGFNIKLNVVVMRSKNSHEIIELLEWSAQESLAIRFIEYMPFFGNEWEYEKVFLKKEMLEMISSKYHVEEIKSPENSTSTNFLIHDLSSSFGIIPTVSEPFCDGCNRIRLTAEGRLKNCLFSKEEDDLLAALRAGENVESIIRNNLYKKQKSAAGRVDFTDELAKSDYASNRSMVAIGG